ncbi:TPA: nucleotide sugar dehydrogenase [Staphylococcus aureus]|uniref:nucleotide sugar dehydrogenase n=1 Tax=Staphylococcus TaxID=1279 RepID=UPI00021AE905|nr:MULTISPECIES: nucleotide sugar dehydrogenase [Staphylococcus]EGS81329.1 nucleotide sugar dehydrogenase [Staphylococcus aureus subsp. aureus 21235]MBS3283191.1 nucleotide sugar dehydrogenase [Staphylococcus aureus]MBS3293046.1 nucleotide sugar dehydrogenase [Staphylococcus aureus]MBS3303681.1 nucleotide sugar dehydrogenase [Staphylococcus aureus]MBS3338690.1 nucleotide sugar dehydrogenase [Staphylococcus aureus]
MNNNTKIGVIGLGYVGMPLAVAFAEKFEVVGFDIDATKVEKYNNNIDPTGEVGTEGLKQTTMKFTSKEEDLKDVNFYVITVPTPIKQDNTPNLAPIEGATEVVGRYLSKDDVVVYESTVYPGVTEDICLPLLEQQSGLKGIEEFKVGYSPERINPGDKKNTVKNIVKIVSGIDEEALEIISNTYGAVIEAGIHKAPNIKVAESAKVVENSQRDINIAFMNELSQVFNRMNINTFDVIDAMNTKWNALGFTPGLVGGHCIGVDPYYFIYQAENVGFHSQIITAGRKINNFMSTFVGENLIKELVKNKMANDPKVVVFGLTFKENTPDFRNSKIINMIEELNEYGIEPLVVDPYMDSFRPKYENIKATYASDISSINSNIDVLVYSVNHKQFKELEDQKFLNLLNEKHAIIVDLKNRFKNYESNKISYWSF